MEIGEEIENGKKNTHTAKKKNKKKEKKEKKKRPKDIRVLIDLKLCFYNS